MPTPNLARPPPSCSPFCSPGAPDDLDAFASGADCGAARGPPLELALASAPLAFGIFGAARGEPALESAPLDGDAFGILGAARGEPAIASAPLDGDTFGILGAALGPPLELASASAPLDGDAFGILGAARGLPLEPPSESTPLDAFGCCRAWFSRRRSALLRSLLASSPLLPDEIPSPASPACPVCPATSVSSCSCVSSGHPPSSIPDKPVLPEQRCKD